MNSVPELNDILCADWKESKGPLNLPKFMFAKINEDQTWIAKGEVGRVPYPPEGKFNVRAKVDLLSSVKDSKLEVTLTAYGDTETSALEAVKESIVEFDSNWIDRIENGINLLRP